MSCYVVNKETIDVLVYGIEKFQVEGYLHCQSLKSIIISVESLRNEIGAILYKQNYDSVNNRYGEDNDPPYYEYEEPAEKTNADIYNAIGEFNYQACETDDYYHSDIYKCFKALKEKMLKRYIAKDCPRKTVY